MILNQLDNDNILELVLTSELKIKDDIHVPAPVM